MRPIKRSTNKIGAMSTLFFVFLLSIGFTQITPTKADDSPEMVWVQTETQVNPLDVQLEFYGGGATTGYFEEPRFEGTFVKYAVTETSFRIEDRWVDTGYEHHNVSIEVYFDKPPLTLPPGETVELIYGFAHSGTAEDAGIRVQFWYDSPDLDIEPHSAFSYAPWVDNFDGTADGVYSFEVPPANSGGEIELYASWWNSGPCLVVWKYEAQPASGDPAAEPAPDKDEEPADEQVDEVASPDKDEDPADEQVDQGVTPDKNKPSTAEDMPDWVKNGEVYIDQSGYGIYVPDWLDWIKPGRVIRARGLVINPDGEVWVYNRGFGKWQGPIQSEVTLYSGDLVTTGPGSSARLVFTNQQGKQDTISVGSLTKISVPSTTGNEEKSDYPLLWFLWEGAVKVKHAATGEGLLQVDERLVPFRTPSVVAGVRGTEFILEHDPVSNTTSIYLISGEVDYYNLAAAGPNDAVLRAGQTLVVAADGEETILPLEKDEFESISAAANLEEPEQQASESKDKKDRDSSSDQRPERDYFWPIVIAAAVIVVIGAAAAVFVLRWRRKAA